MLHLSSWTMKIRGWSKEGVMAIIIFFFSSRRRHTRLQGDWSSDVCSSDLMQKDTEIASPCAPKDELRPSIETAMHAVLRHRVVIHVHSINAIAWAIRVDGPGQLRERLAGLHWQWIPYTASGIPLARQIEKA